MGTDYSARACRRERTKFPRREKNHSNMIPFLPSHFPVISLPPVSHHDRTTNLDSGTATSNTSLTTYPKVVSSILGRWEGMKT